MPIAYWLSITSVAGVARSSQPRHSQPIGRRYLNRLGVGGGLLAAALIACVGLIGLFSFAVWPSSGGSRETGADVTLRPPRPVSQHTTGSRAHSIALASRRGSTSSVASPTGPGARSGGGATAGGGARRAQGGSHESSPDGSREPVPTTGSTTRAPAPTSGSSHGHAYGNGNGDGNGNGGNGNDDGNGNGGGNGNAGGNGNGHGGGGVAHARAISPGNGNGGGNGQGNGG